MSAQGGGWSSVPNWVIRSETLNGTQKLLYIALLNRANDEGNCWPSLKLICRDVGAAKGTVLGALDQLEKLGLVRRSRRINPDGSNDSNMYHVEAWMRDPGGGSKTDPPSSNEDQGVGSKLNPPSSNEDQEEHPLEKDPGEETTAVAVVRKDVEMLLDLFDAELRKNGVTKMPSRGKANTDAMRLMIDKDGRAIDQIARAIQWAQADPFWAPNVMCAAKLREKYEQLQLAAKKGRGGGQQSPGAKAVGLAQEMRDRREGGNPWTRQ